MIFIFLYLTGWLNIIMDVNTIKKIYAPALISYNAENMTRTNSYTIYAIAFTRRGVYFFFKEAIFFYR